MLLNPKSTETCISQKQQDIQTITIKSMNPITFQTSDNLPQSKWPLFSLTKVNNRLFLIPRLNQHTSYHINQAFVCIHSNYTHWPHPAPSGSWVFCVRGLWYPLLSFLARESSGKVKTPSDIRLLMDCSITCLWPLDYRIIEPDPSSNGFSQILFN